MDQSSEQVDRLLEESDKLVRQSLWGFFGSLIVLAALPWIFSAGISYFMLAWRTIP